MQSQQNAQVTNLTQLSLAAASQLVQARKVSPVELTETCLERIDQFDPKLNAFITVTGHSALAQARDAEAEIQRGLWRGPLHGIPIALKDVVGTAGVRTTAACGVFKDRVPAKDAEIVRRLKAAGAVLLGKLNLHECAYGGSSLFSHFGSVKNPWGADYMTGGSSGGSAAAVAAELCYAAIGSDTGGSIRQPAAYCGIVGLKPTYGRVSVRGVIPLSWTFDHVGPMTRTVADAALMLQTLAGYDPEDPVSIDAPVPDYIGALTQSTASIRIGIPRNHFYDNLHPDIALAIDSARAVLRKLTANQTEIEIPAPGDPTVLKAEAYVYHRDHVTNTPELYQEDTLRRIMSGAEVVLVDYINGRLQVDQVRRSILRAFDSVDVLLTPTTTVPPFKVEELRAGPAGLRTKEILSLRNTRPFNILGLPTISLPCGFTRAGLPIGMQLSGRPGDEATVLCLASAYERETEWHERRPNLA
jgi:aspartyl-tRNA(Asn)/glutamyl-tRNA(Gln) amidotransferase subunit A